MARLSPIYVCDALSFLPYTQLQQSRLVSRFLNNTIVDRSGMSVDDDGYWMNSRMESTAENWKHLQEKWGCCSELKADVSPLSGGCILPFHPADDLVDIQIWYGTRSIILRSRNEMTDVTAFGLLHLFDHLRNAAVGEMIQHSVLSLSLFQLLSEEEHYQLHVLNYTFTANPTTVEAHVANFAHLSMRVLWCSVENPVVGFDFALRARPYCNELRILHAREDFFDIALQHFQSILPVIGCHVVSELVLDIVVRTRQIPWPEGVLPKEEIESLGHGIYRQRGVTNINSGERFDVEVMYAPYWGDDEDEDEEEEVRTVRLTFCEGK